MKFDRCALCGHKMQEHLKGKLNCPMGNAQKQGFEAYYSGQFFLPDTKPKVTEKAWVN